MNQKIENYVNMLFRDIPRSKKATELREEMLADISERFDDLMKEGKSENEAYGIAVASLGNVDELMREVMPDAEFAKTANHYRKRKALYLSIGVALYIFGVILLLGLGALGELVFHKAEILAVIGLIGMLLMAAIATALIIYGSMSTPVEYRDFEEQKVRIKSENMTKREKTFRGVSSIYWSVILLLYLGYSFISSQWAISWVIWPLSGVLWEIVKTVFEMRGSDE